MNPIRNIFIGAACLIAITASAQWQWIDKDGRKVFSDRAPPPEVLDKNILKRPAGRGPAAGATDIAAASTATAKTGAANPAAVPASGAAAAASAPQSGASAPKLTGVDKDLVEKKKKADEAEAAKRKTEEEKILKARIENCARAKQAKASFDSGVRIARTNDKGEREVLDDAARAAEMKRIQSIVASDCR
jgi:hypothetical protein